ncbi:hypothetical protein OUZ56_028597 [Daphnia magna]|uniref:Uncharacterized protein n=1 Tax=Daphnia magna TaxID=35525 RepID=A0ABR0B4C3_9CRUS|nr:hypothetical protein OUZ56_028597 [Daphnia magna]
MTLKTFRFPCMALMSITPTAPMVKEITNASKATMHFLWMYNQIGFERILNYAWKHGIEFHIRLAFPCVTIELLTLLRGPLMCSSYTGNSGVLVN